MKDRALQGILKIALEPEWEAKFEASSYGFRPGRSCHDAIEHIRVAIQSKAKYVLDADIAKCFDRINHVKLFQKIGYTGKVRQQIKAWLKSGVVDQGVFTAISEGTPQGGVVSPLLANIALHGIEEMLIEYAKTIKLRYPNGKAASWQSKVQSLTFVRYADDFVVIHQDLQVVQRCRELISKWLNDICLELKPTKTRIAHTLIPDLSKDGIAGFNFLGYNIRQYPSGKYKSACKTNGDILGFNTIINPSKESCKKHQESIKKIIRKHKHSPQALLIQELNPVIRGWCNYYHFSDAQTTKKFSNQDYLVFEKLRAWGRRRCKSLKSSFEKYFSKIGKRNWTFATKERNSNSFRLLYHDDFGSSSNNYVKVKGDKSPYDGNLVYWSTRMGRHLDMPTSKAYKLKKQKGKCNWCELYFREGDILEEDHILPIALGGKNIYENLQLLHGHCHDEKTALDMIHIRNKQLSIFLKKLAEEWSKVDYLWVDDIPVIVSN